jgi:hypothetical protein
MPLTNENFEKGLLENAGEHPLMLRLKQLKRIYSIGWALGVGVAAMLSTGEFKTVLTIVFILFFILTKFKGMRRRFAHSQQAIKDKPSRYLLLVAAFILPSNSRDAALGDMEEIYNKDLLRFGRRWANCLMARDIFCSIFPRLISLPRKMLIILLKIIGLYEIYCRFIGK